MSRIVSELALTWERRRDSAKPAPVSEQRVDRGALLTPRWHGNVLLAQGYAARPGIYEYRNADGTITRELIRPETLARSVAGLARCPVTLDHPDVDVTSENHKDLNVGDVDGDIEVQDDGYVRVKIAIRREDAQTAVTSGRQRELSPGYLAKIDKTPGEHPEYGRYDAEQIDRTYNHLAIVENARGGSRVAIRTDSPRAEMVGTIRSDRAPERGSAMIIKPETLQALMRAGIDVRRVDSEESAQQMLANYNQQVAYRNALYQRRLAAQRGRGGRRDGRRGRRDVDPMSGPAVDPAMMGYPDAEDPSLMMPPGATGDEGEGDPNVYCDEEGNPVLNEQGVPMTKDEVIEQLKAENDELMGQMGEVSNDEEVEELAPVAESMDEDPEAEEFKSDGHRGRRRTDAILLGKRIVERFRGDKVDWSHVTHDQLASYLRAIKDQFRRDGRLDAAPSSGRAAGRAAWDPQHQRRDGGHDNVLRLDSGPSSIAASQYSSAYHARRAGKGGLT